MDFKALSSRILSLLLPHLPKLTESAKQDGTFIASSDEFLLGSSRLAWEKMLQEIADRPGLQESFAALLISPADQDALMSLRFNLTKLLESRPLLAKDLQEIWQELESAGLASRVPLVYAQCSEVLDPGDSVTEELEMIRLLRCGLDPEHIAGKFGIGIDDLYKRNTAYSLGGMATLIGRTSPLSWLDCLDPNDPLLRRLEMVRLHKGGTPFAVIAAQYQAAPEYVEMLAREFYQHGVSGILTEDDVCKFRALHPETVRICTFNLHGSGENDNYRIRRIALGISDFLPDILAFQEVVCGADGQDTGNRIAAWLSSMTGYHYRAEFTYCHWFEEKYPEGVGLVARHTFGLPESIDLTHDLGEDLAPLLPRKADVLELHIYRHRLLVACVHLDHTKNDKVRPAQMEKLLKHLNMLSEERKSTAVLIAGDFNDASDSRTIQILKQAGYRDAYATCHRSKGNTFPLPNPTRRVDYIMVSGDVEIVSSGIMLNDATLSDHAGVFAVLR